MIDHLLSFTDEPTAQTTIPDYYNDSNWRGECCIPNVSVYEITGTEVVTDPDTGATYTQEIRQYFPGWFILIGLPELDRDLQNLDGDACRMIVDRDAALADNPDFILYAASDLDTSILASCRVEPTFAGSAYPFGIAVNV